MGSAGTIDALIGRFEAAARRLAVESAEPVCAYLYDLTFLREHVERVRAELPPGCRLLYAIKANSEARLLTALAGIVDGFEVASLGEVLKARQANPSGTIVFGGPGKTDDELARAIDHGVELIHVESVHELQRLEHVAARRRSRVGVLLRVNLTGPLPVATLAMAGRPTQFGIDEHHLSDALELARRCRWIEVHGFHFHSLSNHLDPEAHARLVRYYLERSGAWAAAHDVDLRAVNAGGGIGVDYINPSQDFDWPTFTSHLAEQLQTHRPPGVSVLFECGRYVVAGCGAYVVEVLDLKINHGHAFAIVRGGTHHFRLPASWQHSHPFTVVPVDRWDRPYPRPELHDMAVTVAGQLCTPKDVLARDTHIDHLRVGDLFVFHYAGAYGWAISHHDFLSHPHPVTVWLEDHPSLVP